jgi:hypothetical protein
MIYGLNFNGSHIPDHVRMRFAQRRSFGKGMLMQLQGVCNTNEEAQVMRIQADNGSRRVFTTRPRKVGRDQWYGVYIR